jgi:hypothetical protein
MAFASKNLSGLLIAVRLANYLASNAHRLKQTP